MSDISNSVSRPYAKAIFEFALDQQQLAKWSKTLAHLAQIVENPLANNFLNNPMSTPAQQSELLFSVMQQVQKNPEQEQIFIKNLLDLLAQNKRLPVLPNIYAQYTALRDAHEKTMVVSVVSFSPLTKKQEEQLTHRLSQRLQRQVTLKISIDPSIHGGMIIYAGHLVFDASVATQIKKLAANLAA